MYPKCNFQFTAKSSINVENEEQCQMSQKTSTKLTESYFLNHLSGKQHWNRIAPENLLQSQQLYNSPEPLRSLETKSSSYSWFLYYTSGYLCVCNRRSPLGSARDQNTDWSLHLKAKNEAPMVIKHCHLQTGEKHCRWGAHTHRLITLCHNQSRHKNQTPNHKQY